MKTLTDGWRTPSDGNTSHGPGELKMSPSQVKPNTIKLVFVASPLSTQHSGERAKTGWLRIRITCPSGATLSTRRLLFQWASTIKMQLSMLVLYKTDLIIISLKINLFSPWYSWQIAELAVNNNHSLTLSCPRLYCYCLSLLLCTNQVPKVLYCGQWVMVYKKNVSSQCNFTAQIEPMQDKLLFLTQDWH